MKRTKPNLKKTLQETLKEVNKAIESGEISARDLEGTRRAITKRGADPERQKAVKKHFPKKTRIRKLNDKMAAIADELQYLAEGTIEPEEGDQVWIKAIKMKGPSIIWMFHKMGVDLNQVYSTLINPGHTLDQPKDEDDPDIIDITPKPKRTTGLVQEKHFYEFWELYPEKKGKQPAQKAWKALCKNKSTRPKWDDIVKGLERYKQADTVKNGYILMPAKWIREQRWTDEISTPIKGKKPFRPSFGTFALQPKEVTDSISYSTGEIHDV